MQPSLVFSSLKANVSLTVPKKIKIYTIALTITVELHCMEFVDLASGLLVK